MEKSPAHYACHTLISTAIHRCRMIDKLCRISIAVKCSDNSRKPGPSMFQISISDTGPGSNVTDFQHLNRCFHDADGTYRWDGVLKITTTDLQEEEVRHYQLTLGDINASSRLLRLPSSPKARGTFSGTEISLCVQGNLEKFVAYIKGFCQKISILKMPTIVLELCLEILDSFQSARENIFISSEGIVIPKSMPNIDRLSTGIVDYIIQYVHGLDKQSHHCYPLRESLRVGKGIACGQGAAIETEDVLEAALVVLEMTEATRLSCLEKPPIQAKVLCFEDFSLSTVRAPTIQALNTVEWPKYGLTVKDIRVGDFGVAVIEWERLQAVAQLYIVLHKYQRKCLNKRKKKLAESVIVKDAVGAALDELKESNPKLFLSKRAKKMKTYVPELSRSISGLIMSSNDAVFKEECAHILGLLPTDLHQQIMESSINSKIVDIINTTDGNPNKMNADKSVESKYEETCHKEQEEEDDNEDSLDESRSIWEFL